MTTTSEPATARPGWEDDEASELDVADEPFVPVPAGLIAEAIELLAVCDELISQRRGSCVNNQLRDLLAGAGITDASVTSTRIRAGFGRTSRELATCLDDTGIWVDPIYLPTYNGRIPR